MKIKSLLLGSAAALIAVSGAQAADAVIIEPEPVEYVRICDAYGAGFFYIPGTETCLKFSGYVRVTYKAKHYHDEDPNRIAPTHRHNMNYRARFNIDARNETEWGTLRSQIRFQGGDQGADNSDDDTFSDGDADGHGSGDANAVVDRALISLAGFRLGYSDDYWTTIGGYGYY
ncbi:MAG: porin, partial [Planctomycetaceae bacterium]|nr:porin [Planctomycetaceae bacterium]